MNRGTVLMLVAIGVLTVGIPSALAKRFFFLAYVLPTCRCSCADASVLSRHVEWTGPAMVYVSVLARRVPKLVRTTAPARWTVFGRRRTEAYSYG